MKNAGYCSYSWFSMYFLIVSRLTFWTVAIKYPSAQHIFSFQKICWSIAPCLFSIAVVDICFSCLFICNGDTFGPQLLLICICSLSLSITFMLKPDNSAIFNTICSVFVSIFPINKFFL